MAQPIGRFAGGLPQLEPCAVGGPGSGAELFVVEGESAAAAVTRIRDPAFQAVLPMRGKPLNAFKASRQRVAGHAQYRALADALGTSIGAEFDAGRLRFDRILLLMDPDADGIHCGVLLLMFFHRWMRPLLEAGRVEVVRPPWGEVTRAGEGGCRLAFSAEELAGLAAATPERAAGTSRRYRGLAALDARVLHANCVAPATRRTEPVSPARVEALMAIMQDLSIT
jgi:DNA gyrase/topoisomerase IV subunit B